MPIRLIRSEPSGRFDLDQIIYEEKYTQNSLTYLTREYDRYMNNRSRIRVFLEYWGLFTEPTFVTEMRNNIKRRLREIEKDPTI